MINRIIISSIDIESILIFIYLLFILDILLLNTLYIGVDSIIPIIIIDILDTSNSIDNLLDNGTLIPINDFK